MDIQEKQEQATRLQGVVTRIQVEVTLKSITQWVTINGIRYKCAFRARKGGWRTGDAVEFSVKQSSKSHSEAVVAEAINISRLNQ